MTVIEFRSLPPEQQKDIAKFLGWQLIQNTSRLIARLKNRESKNKDNHSVISLYKN